jgi:ERCC4-type nuclease
MVIVVDVFEPKEYKFLGHKVKNIGIDFLVVGDIRKFAVERKTARDLVFSMKDGRLFNQLEQLKRWEKEEGYQPLVLIEGSPYWLLKTGRLTTSMWVEYQMVIADWGIPSIHVPDISMIRFVLNKLDEEAYSEKKPIIRVKNINKRRVRSIEDERLDILGAIKGVSLSRAQRLLATFKNIRSIVCAEENALEMVVGGDTARHIKEVFG